MNATAVDPARDWDSLDAGVPLALLPVRLETRFVGAELLIRIDPDVPQQDMHPATLRPDEKAVAQRFWTDIAQARDAGARHAAWATLAAALGPWRAAWAARALKLGAAEGTQRGRPALARLLPARWVAKAWFGGQAAVLGWTQPVRADLPLGFDSADPHWRDNAALEADERAGRLRLDPAARWLTDFDAAEAAGMGLRVVLERFPALQAHLAAGKAIDELLVIGAEHRLDAAAAGARFAALLEAQRYSRGLELVAQGTPTNNTEQVRSGVAPGRPDLDGLLQRELGPWLPGGQPAAALPPQTQGGRLARALGLDRAGLLQRLEQADARPDEAAAALNRLVWPLSFGELFGTLLAGAAEPERHALVDRGALAPLRDWFCEHVRGGAALATLRFGAQPYGVLPVRRLQPRLAGVPQGALARHVNDAVALLRETWREVLPEVPTLRPADDAAQAQAALLGVLGSQPHPWEFQVQRAMDCRELLGAEYAGANWAAAQHAPMLAGLMPNLRFGEPGVSSLNFVHLLFGGAAAPAANTADDYLGMLVCWAKLMCSNATRDALPGIVAAPESALAALPAAALESAWKTAWKFDAARWKEALAGTPVPPVPRTLADQIAYIDWLLGTQVWLVEALKPEGVWGKYHVGLLKRKLALDAVPLASRSAAQTAELSFCRAMLERLGDSSNESIPGLLRDARAVLVLHGQRLAPLEPLYARWGRGSRLQTHLRRDGPTGAFLAFEDQGSARWPRAAALVQPPGAQGGDGAAGYLAELANAAGSGARWDAARVGAFAGAAREAKAATALAGYRASGMSAERIPPLLFQLARAALAATSGAEQEAIRQQLARLAGFDAGELELRLRETLGLVTHRLDAWATGLASEALFAQRVKRPAGLQVGAYGWVEQLRRDEGLRASQGHLLAPSLTHAATAAVLRAGWQAVGGQDPALAVDLSSARVRTGRALLDGLRAGRPLGELLGGRFERALHERGLDRLIDPVRERVAAAAGAATDTRRPVDGLALWNLWNAGDAALKAIDPALPEPLRALGGQLDALLDLATAEGVHQLVQGNLGRMATSMDALGQADVDPPPCTFPDSPRPGRTITHRLLLSLPEGTPVVPGDGWADSPRSVVAPALERWARLALGPATPWRIVARWVDADGRAGAPLAPLALAALGLSALDAVYAGDDAADGGRGWRARVTSAVAAPPSGGAGPWRLELLPDARDGLAAGQQPLGVLLGLARRLRRLLAEARPAEACHYGRPGDTPAPGTEADAGEFAARAAALQARLAAAQQRLAALLPRPAGDATRERWLAALLAQGLDAPALRGALLEAARFGLPAQPLDGLARPGEAWFVADRRRLARQALATLLGLERRVARAAAASAGLAAADPARRVAAARAVCEAVLGRGMPVPAGVRLAAVDGLAAELDASLAVGLQRPGAGAGAPLHWLGQVAKVRPAAARLADLLLHRAGVGAGAVLGWQLAQLPHVAGAAPEAWAATALPGADRAARVCLTACGVRPQPTGSVQALLVDQWNEVIPDGRQTAALAFHFDAPAARAPQAILLAVVPEGRTAWTVDDALETVRETFEWSRLRAVGPAELAQASLPLGQYLPALYSSVPFELPGTLLPGNPQTTRRWRLEGRTRTDDLEPGTRACIADPLWMLGRQWQVGEFQGEDAAMPVAARFDLETTPLRSLRCEAGGNLKGATQALAVPEAAEALAEAQDPARSPGAYAWRAQAGQRLLALLREVGQGALAERVRAAFRLAAPPPDAELGPADRRALEELAAWGADGAALAQALRADPGLAGRVEASAAERNTLAGVAAAWLAQQEAAAVVPAGANGWSPAHLEYGVSLAAPAADGELLLRAAEYAGGRLDWADFDLARSGAHGLAAAPPAVRRFVRLPTPLVYAGMPADRWWEFEDGEVHFGAVQATPADLQRMLLAAYATGFSNDYHVVPVTLAAGQLARVKELTVLDSFGQAHRVESMAVRDHAADAARPWRLFELSGDPGPAARCAPWLLLAPALPDALEGPPLEQVALLRDESANLVWAVERQVEGALGLPVDRVAAWKRRAEPVAAPAAGRWRYQVAPALPPYLVPLLPERGADAQVMLRRGRLQQGVDGAGRPLSSGAVGRILNPGGPQLPLRVHEEEVPEGGLELRRAWQLARDRDGRVWLWLGQRRQPRGAGREPGVVFDRLDTR